jgi:type II secretory pathway pseudopilin PulG
MAVLLIGLSVMAIMMSVAMPVWKQMIKREKEAELVFRGEQYARAIGLFQRRTGPGALPANLDLLVEQRYLRKKYKDPITGDDFLPLTQTSNAPGAPGTGSPQGSGRGAGPAGQQPPASGTGRGVAQAPTGRGAAVGGVIGVVSKSTDESIRLYNGRNHYNEWQFVFVPRTQTPGAGGRGGGADNGRGGGGRQQGPPAGTTPPDARGRSFIPPRLTPSPGPGSGPLLPPPPR